MLAGKTLRKEEASEGNKTMQQRETRDYSAPREYTTPISGDLNELLGKGSEFVFTGTDSYLVMYATFQTGA